MNEIILDQEKSDINGDKREEVVSLLGQRETDGIVVRNVKIEIDSGQTYTINLETNKGYNPTLFLGDFNNDDVKDIMVQMESGSTGLEGYFYIYTFINNAKKEIFNYKEFNNKYKYSVVYQNDYIVTIASTFSNQKFNVDIKEKPYVKDIYNSDGTLKASLKGLVSPIVELSPMNNGLGGYNLKATQRVIGYYNADTLGYIETLLNYQDNGFKNEQITFKRS